MSVEQVTFSPETDNPLHSRFLHVAHELWAASAPVAWDVNEKEDYALWCAQSMVDGEPGLLACGIRLIREDRTQPYELKSATLLAISDDVSFSLPIYKNDWQKEQDLSGFEDFLVTFEDYLEVNQAAGIRDCRTGITKGELDQMWEFGLTSVVQRYRNTLQTTTSSEASGPGTDFDPAGD